MTDGPNYTVTHEQLARASENMRFTLRCARHAIGFNEVPLRTRAISLIEQRLKEGGFAQKAFSKAEVAGQVPRPLQTFVEKRLQLRQTKESGEARLWVEEEARRRVEEEIRRTEEKKRTRSQMDFSPILY